MTINDSSTQNNLKTLQLNGHVGFDTLPDQIVSKTLADGFCFNILCIGETGIGKSTLIDTLFNTKFDWLESNHLESKVKLNKNTYDLIESNVRLKLTIVETVGFGDQIDKDESHAIISNYIDTQFESYLQEELKLKRNLSIINDNRIHVCLYFICPTGHSLKSIDLLMMKKLDSKVNIVPIIAKADTIAKNELIKFKQKIIQDLQAHGVNIYQFPTDDDTVAEINASMNALMPFAVVGSTDLVKVGSKMVKARQYPWGVVIVENESHCDFVKLREMLIRTNMQDLIEKTHFKHYELYRKYRLTDMGLSDSNISNGKALTLTETFEAKQAEFRVEIQKREDEIKEAFVTKVKHKEAELKESERELHDKFVLLKKQHSEQKDRLEDKKRAFEDEKKTFLTRKSTLEQFRTQTLGTLKSQKKK
jgi:septin family protein